VHNRYRTKGDVDEMNKKILIAVTIVVVFAAAAAGVWALKSGGPGAISAADSEAAMPALSGNEEYYFVKLAHPAALVSAITALGDVMTNLTDMTETAGDNELSEMMGENIDLDELPKLMDFLGGITGFIDGTKEMAILVKSPDMTLYLSFLADDEHFNKFISPEGSLRNIEKWDSGRGDGWKFSIGAPIASAEDLAVFNMVRRPAGKSNLVMISSSEEGVRLMTSALDNPSLRMTQARNTTGEDYMLIRLSSDIGWMDGRSPISGELSWGTSGNKTTIQTYTDVYDRTKAPVSSVAQKSEIPLMGNGDLAMFATVDVPFLCFSLFPDSPDPVQTFFDAIEGFAPADNGVTGALIGDMKTLLSQGRLSAAVVLDGENNPSQAYLIIESGANLSINKLFTLITLGINRPAEISGWDTAYSASMSPKMSFVLARKEGAMMLGYGDVAGYGQRANIPDNVGITDASYVSNIYVTSEILDAYEAFQGETIRQALVNAGMPSSIYDIVDLGKIDAIQMKQSELGKGEIDIYWKDQGK
jgi:hypothetical protein